MKVKEIMDLLQLHLEAGEKGLDKEITGGYCGDLLSDVMANAQKDSIWITIQSHQNVVAVAVLRELTAIVLPNGRRPDEETKLKADFEGIPLFSTDIPAFQLAGRLYDLGVDRGEG